VEPARRKNKRKTQDYTAEHSEDGSRTSREEFPGNKISEQKQDPMASFTTTTTTTTTLCIYR
jgi:hypothetical protein